MTNIKLQIKMKIKFINIFLLAVLLLLTIASCTKTDDNNSVSSAQPPDLSAHPVYSKYQFNNTDNVVNLGTQPLFMPTGLITETMKRDNILRESLKKLGVEIRFYSFLKGADVNHFLKSGDLDAGVGGNMPAIFAAATLDVYIPILVQQGFVSIISKRQMLIEALRGKRIAYAYGSNAHYALLNALVLRGIDESQVKLIPMDVVEMPDALNSGKIDAFSAWEPTPFMTLKKYKNMVTIHRSLSSGYMYFMKNFLYRYSDVVREILAAEVRAIKWMQTSRQNLMQAGKWFLQASYELTGLNYDLSMVDIAELFMKDFISISAIPYIPENYLMENGVLQREFEFLKKINKIPSSVNWEKVRNSFDSGFLIEEIIENSEKYRMDEFKYDTRGRSNE